MIANYTLDQEITKRPHTLHGIDDAPGCIASLPMANEVGP